VVWKAIIMPAVHGACLVGYLDGTVKAPPEEITVEKTASGKTETVTMENPEFVSWNEKDQQVMYFLLGSISREVLVQLMEHQTAHAAWKAILDMFSSRSRSRVMNLRRTLNDLKKRDMSAAVYFGKLKAIVDELAMAGKKMDDDDIINALLSGLDSEYNLLVEAASSCIDQGITLRETFSMLQAAEARLAAQNKDTSGRFSANLASRGGHDGYHGGDSGGNCGEFHGNKYTNHRGNGGGGYQGKGGYQGNGGGRGGYQGKNGGRGCYNNNQLGHRPRYNGPPC
jgi:hypothetical protein